MADKILDVLLDSLKDSATLLPFLLAVYLIMEAIEHLSGAVFERRIAQVRKTGPVWGALLGVIPQCGFSAAAASLYAGRVVTVGTLLAVFLSTSDELVPVLLGGGAPAGLVAGVLAGKMAIGMVTGFAVDLLNPYRRRYEEKRVDIHTVCEEEHCDCHDGIVKSAVRHTLKIFFYIFVITLALNLLISLIGEEHLQGLFSRTPVLGHLVTGVVGLIPNCASSVLITRLYLSGIITLGMMFSGLLVNAGVGLLVLVRLNRHPRENAMILGTLFVSGILWGLLVELLPFS